MNRPAYFEVRGLETFDTANPDWKRVRAITLYGPLDAPTKKLIDEAFVHGVRVRQVTSQGSEAIEQYLKQYVWEKTPKVFETGAPV